MKRGGFHWRALTGKHAQVDCGGCHNGASSIAQLQAAPQACYECHRQNDPHAGQMGTNCETCHVTEGWEQVSFDHALTTFPLTGKHLEVECTGCHADGVFAGTATECVACHEEPQFHLGLLGASCGDCHTIDGWIPAQL